jgi:hypothetical protein
MKNYTALVKIPVAQNPADGEPYLTYNEVIEVVTELVHQHFENAELMFVVEEKDAIRD